MSTTFLSALSAGVASTLLAAAVAWVSYAVARRLVAGRAPVSARLAATAVVAAWLVVMAFHLTSPWGLFRLWVVLPAFLLGAAAVRWADRREGEGAVSTGAALGRDLAGVGRVAGRLARRPVGWLAGIVGAVAAVRAVRGLALPPMGWDSMTYHLVKAGRWVRDGGRIPELAPDAWSYYEHYPEVGDVFWAWAMLPFSGDLALALGGLAWWLALLLGVYATARALGASSSGALYGGLAVGSMPAALGYLSSAYVDLPIAALFVLGCVFVVRLLRAPAEGAQRPVQEAPLAAAALALMLGAKLTTAGLFLVAGLAVAGAVVAARGVPWRHRRLALALALVVTVAGTPSYLRAWSEQGSPFYPFPIVLGGVTLSEGAPAAVEGGTSITERESWQLPGGAVAASYLFRRAPDGSFLNFGPGLAVLLLLALAALPLLLPDRRRRWPAVYLLAVGGVMVAGFFSGNMEAFRTTIKATTAGRYLLVVPTVLAVLGAVRSRGVPVQVGWWLATFGGLWLSWPSGWRWSVEGPAVSGVAAWVAGGVVALALTAWLAVRFRRPVPASGLLAGLVAVAAVGVVAAGVADVRAAHRYALYAAAAGRPPLYQMHPLHPAYAAAWPLWRQLDDGRPHRLAVTAGWDGLGHNWYRYPLLGSRLQNTAFYVPVTASGAIVDYRTPEAVRARASFGHWLARLVEREVGLVVSLAPRTTVEEHWMAQVPEVFQLLGTDPAGHHALWRLDREAAERVLQGGAPAQR